MCMRERRKRRGQASEGAEQRRSDPIREERGGEARREDARTQALSQGQTPEERRKRIECRGEDERIVGTKNYPEEKRRRRGGERRRRRRIRRRRRKVPKDGEIFF